MDSAGTPITTAEWRAAAGTIAGMVLKTVQLGRGPDGALYELNGEFAIWTSPAGGEVPFTLLEGRVDLALDDRDLEAVLPVLRRLAQSIEARIVDEGDVELH
jgi:hypothetical protein